MSVVRSHNLLYGIEVYDSACDKYLGLHKQIVENTAEEVTQLSRRSSVQIV